MNVYAYYENHWPDLQYEELVEIWKESWSRCGWTPKVIGIEEAKAHPDYERFCEAVLTMPYLHLPEYHALCFRRYLAMIVVGGGQLVDIDMVNYSYTPGLSPKFDHSLQAGCAPCASPLFYAYLCYRIMHWRTCELVPHCDGKREWYSDMIFLSAYLKPTCVSVNYGQPGWETAPISHYANGAFGNQDRPARIRAARQFTASLV